MKRIIAVILTVMMFVGLVSGCSAGNEKHFEYEDVSGGIKITKYTGNSSKVVVPETIDGKLVVSVGNTFSGNVNITSLELPEECIEANLINCESLTDLAASARILYEMQSSTRERLETLVIYDLDYFNFMSYGSFDNLKKLDISSADEIRTRAYELRHEVEYIEDHINETMLKKLICTSIINSVFCAYFPKLEEVQLSEDLCAGITIEDSLWNEIDGWEYDQLDYGGDQWKEVHSLGCDAESYRENYPNSLMFSKNEYNETILNALGYDELTINGVKCKK